MHSSMCSVRTMQVCFDVFSGCERYKDHNSNIYNIARAKQQSSQVTPEWEELDVKLQHPRVDCGYFQLGKSCIK
jgi:hypothetical protein